jgi:hypothetical protein
MHDGARLAMVAGSGGHNNPVKSADAAYTAWVAAGGNSHPWRQSLCVALAARVRAAAAWQHIEHVHDTDRQELAVPCQDAIV